MMLTILNGLGSGYHDIATFITGSKMEFDDAYTLLLTYETRLEQEHDDKNMLNANYAYANTYYPKAFYGQAKGNFRRGGYIGGSYGNVGSRNHEFGRGNFGLQRMFNGAADDGWYLDSGATHHLTNNMENLQLREEYKALKDMLFVPSITKNLLSISKLTSDNSLSVEFCGNIYFVKDVKGQVLLQGLAKKGLYKLLLKPKSLSSSLASHLSQSQLNKPVSMLSVSIPSSAEHKVVGNKWVFRVKQNNDGSIAKYKAQLIVKDFQQTKGVDYFETFSPVVKSSIVIIVLSLATMHRWTIRQVDVNNAFLNGELTEDVFMCQPEGFVDLQKPSYVCKLKNALYGLKQAPRAWYDKLRDCLVTKWGLRNSRADTSLFCKRKQSSMIFILIYVDDILITGLNNAELEQFISEFSKVFALKDLGELSYFLGIEVSYVKDDIYLSQRKYIRDSLSKADLLECKGCDTPMVIRSKLQKKAKGYLGQYVEDPTGYRSLVGGLQYLVLIRPEIAYAVYKLSQYVSAPPLQHIIACKRVLRKSTGAYCIYFGRNLISWSSKKQSVVARSSVESVKLILKDISLGSDLSPLLSLPLPFSPPPNFRYTAPHTTNQ
ncbi:hypothetical protein KPL70_021080 [Citrus sinensis]|nr:hypothetical protein KPL70_021080 [Citrus sinensis]